MVQGWMNELMGKEEQVKDKRMTVKSVVPAHFEAGNTEKYKLILRWGISHPREDNRRAQRFDGSKRFVGCETQSGRVCLVLSEDAVYWFVYGLCEPYLR